MDEFVGCVEQIVHEDPGDRKLKRVFERTKGELAAAAESLSGAGRVLIATGFFVPFGAPESDGPPGGAALAWTLVNVGVEVDFVTDPECAAVLDRTVSYLRR